MKLLRALQEGEVDPVGAKRSVRVDVRLVSATNQNLIELVKQGRFREDLFYRLNVFPITIPPLRNRRDDVPDLARRFAARFAAEEGKKVAGITAEALALLARYDWPGNVRQLENVVFRAVVLCRRRRADGRRVPADRRPGRGLRRARARRCRPSRPPRCSGRSCASRCATPTAMKLLDDCGDVRRMEEMEAELIRFALAHYRGQMSRDGAQARHRALDPLSQDEGLRPQRGRRSRRLNAIAGGHPAGTPGPAPRCGTPLSSRQHGAGPILGRDRFSAPRPLLYRPRRRFSVAEGRGRARHGAVPIALDEDPSG